jgi:ketosteroid isomerase-like protein
MGGQMSRENLDLALLMYEVFNRRDLDAMFALAHDQVVLRSRAVRLTKPDQNGFHHHARGEQDRSHRFRRIMPVRLRSLGHGAPDVG